MDRTPRKGDGNAVYTYNTWAGDDNIGQIVNNSGTITRYYYLKDHLGNIKMTVDVNGYPQAWNDYDPFGETMAGRNQINGNVDARYNLRHPYYEIYAAEIPPRAGFTSKERDVAETGYDYFGARYYDSWNGRWLSVDPLAEKFPSWSPYVYTLDNSLRNDDPNGAGARDRVYAATVLLAGINYKNELGRSLRAEWTPEAIKYMDCSEVAQRIMYMDGITRNVMNMSTNGFAHFVFNMTRAGLFVVSNTPQVGDFALWGGYDEKGAWSGHISLVTEVEKNSMVKFAGDWRTKVKSGEKGLMKESSLGHPFLFYFRPATETPDGKLEQYKGLQDYMKNISAITAAMKLWGHPWGVSVDQYLDYYWYTQKDATSVSANH